MRKQEDLENLIIYRKYVDLIMYVNHIVKKYPKHERYSLVNDTKEALYDGLKGVMKAQKEFDKNQRLHYLADLDVSLKIQKVLIRVAYKNQYINVNNYAAWSNKLTNISNLLGAWIKSCQRQ